jgi:ferrochelatase
MFPQYAGATTGSVTDTLQKLLAKHSIKIPVKILPPFYNQASFVENSARIAKDFLLNKKVDHYVFSFHGLPEKQVLKHGCEMSNTCYITGKTCVTNCYRAQCHENSRLLAKAMSLQEGQWTVAFQSRLGRAKWIGPSTDETIQKLAQDKIKSIAVLCPSFVADCIETIEEIGMGAREDFLHHGGENLHLVPCLNADPDWARDFAKFIKTKNF